MEQIKKLLVPILIIIVLVLGGMTFYFRSQLAVLQEDPQKVAADQVAEVVAKVGKLILLPSDETPTIAIVSDPEKLKDQTFFMNAKQGDQVLIYTNAKKAILYDPIADKIMEVAPVTIGEPVDQ